MTRRLAGAALAFVIAGGAGQAIGKPPAHASDHRSAGVMTLDSSGGEGWRPSDMPGDPFTPVGVIGGRSVNAEVDPNGALGVGPPDPTIIAEGARLAKPAPHAAPVKGAAVWLPEPATWALLLVGLAMIGFALRGLVAARRRLTNLEEAES